MDVTVIRAGMMTTVQDLGRAGHLSQGIPSGGAMDPFALRVANLLVGNAEDAPALEVTLTGPELEFSGAAWVAVCGAAFEGVPGWRPVRIDAGGRLKFGPRSGGCRAYLAISGGFNIARVQGGAGTYLAAGFGGFQGRILKAGDVIRSAPPARVPTAQWRVDERVLPRYSREPTVRVTPGAQAADFGTALHEARFTVSARSDRMGIRLEGSTLTRPAAPDLVSSAVAPGTVQVPPDGNPIVLMADAQTLGGYPRAAHVVAFDRPLLAQLAPGDAVRFAPSTVADAHALARAQERNLGLLRQGIASKLRAP